MNPLFGLYAALALIPARSTAPAAPTLGIAVVTRCAAHYGVSPATFRAAVRNARVCPLPPGDYTVWLTHTNGLVYPTLQHRTAATQVLTLPLTTHEATSVSLEAATGNPIEPFRPVEYVVVITEPVTETVEKPVYTEMLVKVGE